MYCSKMSLTVRIKVLLLIYLFCIVVINLVVTILSNYIGKNMIYLFVRILPSAQVVELKKNKKNETILKELFVETFMCFKCN